MVKQLWNMFIHFAGRKKLENQKLTSIFNFQFWIDNEMDEWPTDNYCKYYFVSDISQANKVTTNMTDNALNLMVLFLAPVEGKQN